MTPLPKGPAVDCLIVGGGPAGLTAAIYLARFLASVRVMDAGEGRAAMIPRTRNHAGYPGGIPGAELIARMREQALEFGARIDHGTVTALQTAGEDFVAITSDGPIAARSILLATGVTNLRPPMAKSLHDAAVGSGRLRYCPVCDGFEVMDRKVGVVGTGAHGVKEATFLRSYTADVTLIAPDGAHALDAGERARLAELGVAVVDGPARDFALEPDGLSLSCGAGRLSFASVYPAMGSKAHADLAIGLGARAGEAGCIAVDAHQRTSVPGLYAAGDVVMGLDQISHAMGEAGVAATTIRNDLAKRFDWRRPRERVAV